MLGAAVGFFRAVLSAVIDTLNHLMQSDWVAFWIIIAVFGVGGALVIVQMLASAGSSVALKIGIIVVAILSLSLAIFSTSLAMFSDMNDSNGIVG